MTNFKENIPKVFIASLLIFGGLPFSLAVSAPDPLTPGGKQPANAPGGRMDSKLVQINEDSISAGDYATYLQRHPEIVAKAAKTSEGKKEAVREMVIAYLLRAALYDEGFLKKGDEEPQPRQVSEAYEKLAEKHFPRPPVPDEKEMFAYYEAHPEEFGIPSSTRLSQIEFHYKHGADPAVIDATKDRANKALKRLEGGEAFSEVAQALTENPIGKITKGDIGFVNFLDFPWMGQAVSQIKVGERTGIVEAPEGFQILMVTDVRPGLTSPYANVREKVSKNMRDADQNKLRMIYVKELAKKAKITIVLEDLKTLFPNGIFD